MHADENMRIQSLGRFQNLPTGTLALDKRTSAADAATSALLYGQHHGETHQAPLFTKLGFDGPRVQKGMTQPLGESNASSHDGERMNARAYSLL